MRISELPEVLEVKDIQLFLGIGRSQAYNLAKSKSFHAVYVGKRILISKNSFLDWFEGSQLKLSKKAQD
ncbi:helix-turn-helix domain-containing protein [Mesobacillus subterraneus]|uniref:helix-turn-helix domain-containing protein n=1 Tax=Mesobacillus subterraneus TaxID=285983 RepID=UPI00203B7B42|nr:helix-turn-helix domain-containing protein [Mesobacillus subterraneus]MCM3572512.1 helix-turn-helix domain-containing protein [Mesobacillus subterraneus]